MWWRERAEKRKEKKEGKRKKIKILLWRINFSKCSAVIIIWIIIWFILWFDPILKAIDHMEYRFATRIACWIVLKSHESWFCHNSDDTDVRSITIAALVRVTPHNGSLARQQSFVEMAARNGLSAQIRTNDESARGQGYSSDGEPL